MNNLSKNAGTSYDEPVPCASGRPGAESFVASPGDRILVTGAAGFIGPRVIESLLQRGFRNIGCVARPSSKLSRIKPIARPAGAQIEVLEGNLLSRADCEAACKDVAVIFHLAAALTAKSFPDAYMNSVVTTRNLLEASVRHARLRRFVLVSSICVYTNRQKGCLLDESCPIDEHPETRGEAYCFAKVKQEQIVAEFAKQFGLPYVVVRPGSVYGPGQSGVTGRVGISTFGPFLHLGGSNTIPFSYVNNCADAIVLAGLVKGIDGEAFNVVDDNLPTSRQFLHRYKQNAGYFKSIYVPRVVSYSFCYLWEKYSEWSEGQLPPAFNRGQWYANWKKTRYSNEKVKAMLGWKPRVSTDEGLQLYFDSCHEEDAHA
jgi:nucleoside-diphosphate-sugar epimerase